MEFFGRDITVEGIKKPKVWVNNQQHSYWEDIKKKNKGTLENVVKSNDSPHPITTAVTSANPIQNQNIVQGNTLSGILKDNVNITEKRLLLLALVHLKSQNVRIDDLYVGETISVVRETKKGKQENLYLTIKKQNGNVRSDANDVPLFPEFEKEQNMAMIQRKKHEQSATTIRSDTGEVSFPKKKDEPNWEPLANEGNEHEDDVPSNGNVDEHSRDPYTSPLDEEGTSPIDDLDENSTLEKVSLGLIETVFAGDNIVQVADKLEISGILTKSVSQKDDSMTENSFKKDGKEVLSIVFENETNAMAGVYVCKYYEGKKVEDVDQVYSGSGTIEKRTIRSFTPEGKIFEVEEAIPRTNNPRDLFVQRVTKYSYSTDSSLTKTIITTYDEYGNKQRRSEVHKTLLEGGKKNLRQVISEPDDAGNLHVVEQRDDVYENDTSLISLEVQTLVTKDNGEKELAVTRIYRAGGTIEDLSMYPHLKTIKVIDKHGHENIVPVPSDYETNFRAYSYSPPAAEGDGTVHWERGWKKKETVEFSRNFKDVFTEVFSNTKKAQDALKTVGIIASEENITLDTNDTIKIITDPEIENNKRESIHPYLKYISAEKIKSIQAYSGGISFFSDSADGTGNDTFSNITFNGITVENAYDFFIKFKTNALILYSRNDETLTLTINSNQVEGVTAVKHEGTNVFLKGKNIINFPGIPSKSGVKVVKVNVTGKKYRKEGDMEWYTIS
jgi:hypothetical protein